MTYKVQILLTMDVAFETPLADPHFFLEEHYCVDNLLKRALEEQACNCYRATVHYLGIAPMGEVALRVLDERTSDG